MNTLLTNEKLVRVIMRRTGGSRPEHVQVRVVIEEKGEVTNEVVSLKTAIQLAVQKQKDLIETALEAEVPVIRIGSLAKLVQEKTKALKQKSPRMKELRLSTVIEERDFDLKLSLLLSFLRKGHPCKVRVDSKRRSFAEVEDPVGKLVGRIVEKIEEEKAGDVGKTTYNEERTRAMVLIQGYKS